MTLFRSVRLSSSRNMTFQTFRVYYFTKNSPVLSCCFANHVAALTSETTDNVFALCWWDVKPYSINQSTCSLHI